MQYLSEEWIAAADEALSSAWADAPADDSPDESDDIAGDRTTTIEYTVTGAPRGKVTYHLHLGPDGAGMAEGPADGDADATMALDYDTAVEVARGESSAQVTFMQGRLKLGGDVMLLVRGAAALARVGDALASLRDRTEY